MANSPTNNLSDKADVLSLLNHIGDQEKHFNGLETRYRLLASSWLLASLGACGYILQKEKGMEFDKDLLIGLIGAMGSTGIFLLWLLDAKVYHKLLHCVFLQGINLEQQYSWLPKIRTDMLLSQETGDVTRITGLYYTCSMLLLLIIADAGLINYVDENYIKYIIGSAGLILIGLLIYYTRRSSLSVRAKKLFDKLNETYVDEII
jgi:hypothetical protein